MTTKWNALLRLAVTATAMAALLFVSSQVQAQSGGEKVYKAKCAACHGPDGTGNTPTGKAMKVPSLCSEEAKKATDAQWTETITKGKNKMPGYDKKLTEAEIKDVIAYARGLCKK